jgi:hypothetical protein
MPARSTWPRHGTPTRACQPPAVHAHRLRPSMSRPHRGPYRSGTSSRCVAGLHLDTYTVMPPASGVGSRQDRPEYAFTTPYALDCGLPQVGHSQETSVPTNHHDGPGVTRPPVLRVLGGAWLVRKVPRSGLLECVSGPLTDVFGGVGHIERAAVAPAAIIPAGTSASWDGWFSRAALSLAAARHSGRRD